LEKKFKLSNL